MWGTTDGDSMVWGTTEDGDNIVWGTVLRGRRWRKTPLPLENPSNEWFLDPRNDAAWIKQEFGDTFMLRGGNRH